MNVLAQIWLMNMFDRIVADPEVLGGKPCIRGTRISVQMILEWIASGATREAIVGAYPQLNSHDIEQAVLFAAHSLKNDLEITAEVSA